MVAAGDQTDNRRFDQSQLPDSHWLLFGNVEVIDQATANTR